MTQTRFELRSVECGIDGLAYRIYDTHNRWATVQMITTKPNTEAPYLVAVTILNALNEKFPIENYINLEDDE